jgi:hypothetical protein
MAEVDKTVAGLTPQEWEEHLELVADDPEKLQAALEALDREMHQESSWVHENPTPGPLFKAVFRFFGKKDDDIQGLGQQIKVELHAERRLQDRYRGWLPGEEWCDRLFPYLKDFGGEVHHESGGLQFEGFTKYKGVERKQKTEVFAFYLNERFPGRAPANFHLSFNAEDGELVIERVYKMELPRPSDGPSVVRLVMAELEADVVPKLNDLKKLVVDNAANVETRQALIEARPDAEGVNYEPVEGADVDATPLGHLMRKFISELGLDSGDFVIRVNRFGVLKIILPIKSDKA